MKKIIFIFLTLLVGCASISDIERLEASVDVLKTRVKALEQNK